MYTARVWRVGLSWPYLWVPLVTAGACGGLRGDGLITGLRAAEPRVPLVLEASWWRLRVSQNRN